VLKIIDTLPPITSPNMKSDLVTGAALARAAVGGALANVDINLQSLKDLDFVTRVSTRAKALRIG